MQIPSRGPNIDMQKCVAQAGNNIFQLIVMVARRAREIKRQQNAGMLPHTDNATVTALMEIEVGKHT